MNQLRLPFATLALLFLTSAGIAQAQVYKWTDASGQVHYGQKKPDDATPVQTLDIAPPSSVAPPATDPAAEVARINALSEQMAREREATEKARQEQAIRDLEQANRQLQNDLLNQQQQQQQQQNKDESDRVILGYPLPYPYPYPYPDPYPRPRPPYPPNPYPPNPYPPNPYPPSHRPCEPWPTCHQSRPPTPSRPGPLTKPNPTFQPAPIRIDSARQDKDAFTGR
jgi:hypothetical protein